MVSEETAARIDPGWLSDRREGGHLLRALERGASPVPPPEAVGGRDLAAYVPRALRDHLAVASGDAEHRQVTVAFVKALGTDAADDDPPVWVRESTRSPPPSAEACDALRADVARVRHRHQRGQGLPDGWRARRRAARTRRRWCVRCARSARPTSACDSRGRQPRTCLHRRHRLRVPADVRRHGRRRQPRGASDSPRAGLGRSWRRRTCSIGANDVRDRGGAVAREGQRSRRDGAHRRRADGHARRHVRRRSDDRRTGSRSSRCFARRSSGAPARAPARRDRRRPRRRQVSARHGGKDAGARLPAARSRRRAVREGRAVRRRSRPLRQLVGITPDTPREQAGAQLTLFVSSVAARSCAMASAPCAAVRRRVPPTPDVDFLDPTTSRDRRHETLATFLDRVLMMPTLSSSRTRTGSTMPRTGPLAPRPHVPGAAVARRHHESTRYDRARGSRSPSTRIELAPLAALDAAALALESSETAPLRGTIDAVIARSGGNPLFVRPLVVAAAAGETLDTLPETIESTLTALIDPLAPSAACAPTRCRGGTNVRRVPCRRGPRRQLEGGTRWEAMTQFVLPEGDNGYRFRHDLVRKTAYEGLSYRRRREIHGRVAALERRVAGRENDEAALLSLHFHRRVPRQGVAERDGGGNRAAAGYANVDAAGLYSERSRPTRRSRESAAEARASARRWGTSASASPTTSAAPPLTSRRCHLADDDPRDGAARLGGKLALLDEHVGALRGRHPNATTAHSPTLGHEDPSTSPTRARLELGRAGVRYRQANYDETIAGAVHAARRKQAESADDAAAHAHALHLLGCALKDVGRDGVPSLEQAIAMYEELGDLVGAARSLEQRRRSTLRGRGAGTRPPRPTAPAGTLGLARAMSSARRSR